MLRPLIRPFDRSLDYQSVQDWWTSHGWSAVPAEMLPATGFVAHEADDLAGIAAGWLYLDNSVGVSWLEWLVTKPRLNPRLSVLAITAISEVATSAAKSMGYGVMITTCRQKSLGRLLEKNGFVRTDEGVTHLMKGI